MVKFESTGRWVTGKDFPAALLCKRALARGPNAFTLLKARRDGRIQGPARRAAILPFYVSTFFPSAHSDRFLMDALFVVGALLAGLGCYVSIAPPKALKWRLGSALVFVLLFTAGFLVTNEQAKRSERASKAQLDALEQDAANKAQYDRDIVSFQGQIKGVQLVVAALARGSGNQKWNEVLSKLTENTKDRPVPCNAGQTNPYKCMSNADLGRLVIDESNRLTEFADEGKRDYEGETK